MKPPSYRVPDMKARAEELHRLAMMFLLRDEK